MELFMELSCARGDLFRAEEEVDRTIVSTVIADHWQR
jgi:hypothetical protein